MKVPVTRLQVTDRFAFRDMTGAAEFEVVGVMPQAAGGDLTVLELAREGTLTVPSQMEVYAVRMMRPVDVPCLGHVVRTIHDWATGPKPFRIICGRCDEKITREVMASMDAITDKRAGRRSGRGKTT